MADTTAARAQTGGRAPTYQNGGFTYDQWMAAQGVPVHKGFYIEDLRTVPLGRVRG